MKSLIYCYVIALGLFVLLHISGVTSQGRPNSRGRPDPTKPIKCYQCNSFYDKGCADFFDNKTYPLKPCANNATMCRKIIQETYYDGMWDIRYIRQCAVLGEVGPDEGRWCKERTGTFRVKVKYCHCDNKDGCNTAAKTLQHSTLAMTSLLIIAYLLTRLRTQPG